MEVRPQVARFGSLSKGFTVKIVCAPDSFKESMTAQEAARCLAQGIRRALPDAQCIEIPLADGGEGFTEALSGTLGARPQTVSVQGPLGDAVEATIGLSADRAIVEVAQAVGLSLVPPDCRSTRDATSYGVGTADVRECPAELLPQNSHARVTDNRLGFVAATSDAVTLKLPRDWSPKKPKTRLQCVADGLG